MGDKPDQSPPVGATDILRYFLRHPEAADSIYGIARWRLLEEAVHRSVESTATALRWLVDQQFLLERRSVARDPLFYLNSKNLKNATELINSSSHLE